jgi:hypothetical protein
MEDAPDKLVKKSPAATPKQRSKLDFYKHKHEECSNYDNGKCKPLTSPI